MLSAVTAVVDQLRTACAEVAARAGAVALNTGAIGAYARLFEPVIAARLAAAPDPDAHLVDGTPEELAAFWLTLDAINFGSGWFPTLTKPDGRSGYFTIATAVRRRFDEHGPWSANELTELDARAIAAVTGQDPHHPLMALFAESLNDLGRHVAHDLGGRFAGIASTHGDAVALVEELGSWACFTDRSTYDGIDLPFLKRAQIAVADLAAVQVIDPPDLDRLTMFADNLVPHVLRLDGVLTYKPEVVRRIDQGELLEHGSPEEVEIRACAVHAVELIAAELPGVNAAEIDRTLWNRGREPRYKAVPRHRSRCTAY